MQKYRNFIIQVLYPLILLMIFFLSTLSKTIAEDSKVLSDSLYTLHVQHTFINQIHPNFIAKYSGKNSLISSKENCLSMTATCYSGVKLWRNAEVYLNPEISGGSGFSKVQGIAGFTNNEVVRVGSAAPTFYLARLFLQQTVNIDGDYTVQEDDENQIHSLVSEQRLVFRLGKFSSTDYFDNNKYSHDGRSQFMNWAFVSNGSWDYAADTRGYTMEFMTEYISRMFSIRLALAMVPNDVNGKILPFNSNFIKTNKTLENNSFIIEFEKLYNLHNQNGTARLLIFKNSSNCFSYNDVLQSNIYQSDSLKIFQKDGNIKYGVCLNLEQDIDENAGLFLRAGWNNGKTETWMFSEIDRNLSCGTVLHGNYWKRAHDEVGVAIGMNGLSDPHKKYLKSGRYGFLIGDGNLNYSAETILETYYKISIIKDLSLSLGYQTLVNPAYNKDRGPVNVFSIRTQTKI